MFVNHLNHQKSPYLLQHVNNPVDWYPWGREAFEKAVSENKPILLSIGYSTCHWCHVMAHESFENEDIAKIINAHFISIKVDREERPDIDQIYMSATTMITGQGGWPLTAFLTPQGKPFFAGTYFPPYAKWGSSGFVDILNAVAEGWKNQQEEILKSGDSITKSLLEHSQKFVSSSQMPSENLLVLAYRHISSQFDSQNGGFGSSPKFPMGHQLSFLLRYYKRFKDPKALEMVEMTLSAVSNGGINDQLAGGFHRYSTDAYWHVPHFEKMLYDQGLLAKAYLEAYQLTGYKDFMMTAKNTLDYVINYMQDSKGGFYTAEDADSLDVKTNHSSEGAFYVWSEEEIDRILNVDEANIFKFIFGVNSQGNANYDPHGEFINKNILSQVKTLQEASEALHLSFQVVEESLENSKKKLLKVRDSRPKPSLDNKVLTDWNGLMISVLTQAAVILRDDKYLQAANKAADFILENSTKDGRLLHSWCHDKAQVNGLLDDYVYFINGLIDLYEISLKENVLQEALKLAKNLDKFEDFENGGFYLTEVNSDDLIIRPKEIYDGAMPSGNSLAAYVLIRVYYLTSDHRWLERFEKLFKNFAQTIEKMPSAYSFALTAFDFYLGQHVKISIEGKMDEMIHQETNRIILKYYIPNKTISRVSTEGAFKVNLCLNNTCLPPINDLKEFELKLLQTQE